MHLERFTTIKQLTLIFLAGCCVLLLARVFFSRTAQFKSQVKIGQPIVQAVENYHRKTGHYPASLAVLTPEYLTTTPSVSDVSHRIYTGWDYELVTNSSTVSYRLKYYLGRGGVEYEPPIWYGDDEGTRTVIFKNQ